MILLELPFKFHISEEVASRICEKVELTDELLQEYSHDLTSEIGRLAYYYNKPYFDFTLKRIHFIPVYMDSDIYPVHWVVIRSISGKTS